MLSHRGTWKTTCLGKKQDTTGQTLLGAIEISRINKAKLIEFRIIAAEN